MSAVTSRAIIFLVHCIHAGCAHGPDNPVLVLKDWGNQKDEIHSPKRLQSFWDLQSTLAAKPNRVPLDRSSLKVSVNASIGVINIIDVNERLQTVTMTAYLQLWWRDQSLTWNQTDYNGVDALELPSYALWTPDVVILNALSEFKVTQFINTFHVKSDGRVYARLAMNVETLCAMDLGSFPYDTHGCPVSVFSYSQLIEWSVVTDDLFNYAFTACFFHGAFVLENATTELLFVPYYGELLPVVWLTLRRKTTFYTVCLILPMVLESFMNTLVFILPAHTGEKVSFIVALSVSTSVFLGFFSEQMPRGLDKVPSIMWLQIILLTESLLFTLATIFIVRRQEQQGETEEEEEEEEAKNKQSTSRPDCCDKTQSGPADHRFCKFCSPRISDVSVTKTIAPRGDTVTRTQPHERESISANLQRYFKSLSGGSGMACLFRKNQERQPLTPDKLDRIFFCIAFFANSMALIAVWWL